MFAVVMCHCCDPFTFTPSVRDPEILRCGAVYGSMLRPCVPLFVMITGALLLPVRQPTGPFLRRRIGRVVWPFLLWSMLYCLFPWLLRLVGLGADTLLAFFPYASEALQQQSLGLSLENCLKIATNFGEIDAHMWYIYLLIGLYLYMPIFSAWVEKASERAKLAFLCVWAVTLFIPYYREYVDPYIWGSCSWNEFSALYYFAGFNGYLLAGHYLRNHRPSMRQLLLFGVPAFAIGYAVTFFGFSKVISTPGHTAEQLELFYYFLSPNVALMTIPIFALTSHINPQSPRIRTLLADLTACGFGVYMVHFFLTGPCIALMRAIDAPLYCQIPCAALIAFPVSWAFAHGVRALLGRRARYVVG